MKGLKESFRMIYSKMPLRFSWRFPLKHFAVEELKNWQDDEQWENISNTDTLGSIYVHINYSLFSTL